MMLEDFFTLTEMKNGLTTFARVKELICTMQQQQDCVVANAGDAVRQWSTVASTLAATESKDCLDHFVKLNGLRFLNQWLEELLKYSNGTVDGTVEGSIHAILGSLEKLSVDREHLITSGIHATVEKLLRFKGVAEERARVLYERWKHAGEDDLSYQDVVKPRCSSDAEAVNSANSTCLDFDDATCRERASCGNCGTESNVTIYQEAAQVDNTNDGLPATDRTILSTSSNLGDNTLVSSPPLSSGQDNVLRTEDSSVGPATEITSSGTWNSSDTHADKKTCDASTLNDDGAAKESRMDVDTKDDSSQVLPSSSFDFDSKESKYHVSETMETVPQQELHSNGSEPEKEDSTETSFQKKEVVESGSEADQVVSRMDVLDPHDSSKMGKIDQTSEFGLEGGELDALEVARQVAIEVEREVVDYREPFFSSSPEGSSGEAVLAEKSLLIAEKSEQDQPDGPTSPNEEPDMRQDEMPKQEEDACESIGKSDRERLDFDLNEDVCDEKDDYTVSAPIAVAALKRAPLLPVAPICFEGDHGWKGSAATSAFRPASWKATLAGQKRKSNFMEIDLNVADSGGDGDSSEVGSRRADRIKLDLNFPADDDDDDQMEYVSCGRLPHRNSEQTMSPASSSSLRRHRDFDLNDNPSFFDTVGSKVDVSAITMMGTRMVGVESRDFLTATMSSRPMLPYTHIPLSTYGYNGLMMGPGSFPYPMDSRGITGTGSVNSVTASTRSFLDLNSASTRSFLDLNSGSSTVESGIGDFVYPGLFNS